ncbi:hypothetical protein HC251_13450 [Iamia sp. SCSIO 61187]|uniref:hypothetical protein n=1 Tax=Iamia sp. SCSIO 61187 TaxID=2722752 RepID=UPI001C62EACE|nr:hypothetical protein [Iamia sp. SCSIO 61187]QYG93330.1 hypothetical protein HC251_13450 [Iamia sp. SCSIO 61187]
MLRRFVAGTRAALSPANIKAAMQAGLAAAAVMPNGREVHQARRIAAEPPTPEVEAAAARAAALARHRHPGSRPIAIDRFTVPGPGLEGALAVLSESGLAGRTHEVWGCYPSAAVVRPLAMVDGRLGLPASTLGPCTLPWVEWTVVHAGGPELSAGLSAAAAAVAAGAQPPHYVASVRLARGESWLDRPRADPLPFDEDLAALMAHHGGVDPAYCLGVHRVLDWGVFGPPQQRSVMVEPSGVQVLGRNDAGLREARSTLARGAPLRCLAAEADDLPIRVEVLDPSLRSLIEPHPWTGSPPELTAYPDLPVDADELLRAYLEIVGVDPGDCYGVSTSIREQQSAPVVPSAGDTERGDAASLVTLVYRDRDAYEDGRERFAVWSRDETGTVFVDEREAVDSVQRWGNRALKVKNVDTIGLGTFREHNVGQEMDVQLYPYCAGPRPTP